MQIKEFSKKQAQILKFAFSEDENIICDGAVRSGKTIVMIVAFVIWAMANFDKTNFAICGKTVTTVERNVKDELEQVEGLPFSLHYKTSKRMLVIKCGKTENYFYLFGGKDKSSYTLIQGATLGGVFFDEVALMPQSFVDQAIARTLSYSNAKIWFNCNPETPDHWFYNEWLQDKTKEFVHLHFLMTDNPILTDKEIQRAENLYTGVFHDRYIKGLWVRAEGLIYPYFANHNKEFIIDKKDLPPLGVIQVGVDFGGNGSQHAFVCTGFSEDFKNIYVLKAKCYTATNTSVKDVINYYQKFIEDIKKTYGFEITDTFADSAEQAIINSMRSETGKHISNSIKNEIIDRIRCEDLLISGKRLFIVDGECQDLIDGLNNAVWEADAPKDTRLDDGTSNIDVLDAFEYSFEKYIKILLR